jgi:formylglycine-generating enzyme required for sulfatase activity
VSSGSSVSPNLFAVVRPKSPYPGLRPFEVEEWSIFFGRERMIDETIERLGANRMVMIHGSSGSGKSSLVRAGVLPKLARQHLRAGAAWQTCSIRPSGGPLWNLAKEFARLEGDANDLDRVRQIMGQFNRQGATLSVVAGSLKSLNGQRLCILVDQFEELFRFAKDTSREEAELFVDLLVRNDTRVSESDGGANKFPNKVAAVHVIVTMRSEFLGECAQFDGLAEAINRTQYLVPPMDHDGLLRAIRRPAPLYGGEVSLELAERLVADVEGREDELPLIQHGLMYMWNAAVAKAQPGEKIVLEATALEAAGRLVGTLSDHADTVVDAAASDPERRYAVERLFRALTDWNVEGRAIRRPQAFRDLVAVTDIGEDKLRKIIDALRRDGVSFLTPYSEQPITERTPIDISHEALIRCWNRLADPRDGWLRREFDDGLIWRSLLIEAKGFEADKHRILSPATTKERWHWWQERRLNGAWAERYGGNFALVGELMSTSRRSARRKRLIQQTAVGMLLLTSFAGVAYAVETNRVRLELLADIYLRHTILSLENERALKPKDQFRECTRCPDMVVVPGGTFDMGSTPNTESIADDDEFPRHRVNITERFAVSKFEVTFENWDACYELGGCRIRPDDYGWGRGSRPVIGVNWDDAQQYVDWLSNQSGKVYRLLSEAEWEYAARAGTTTAYFWGDDIKRDGKAMADCSDCGSLWDNKQTAPVGSFPPNEFGLYDMLGNVWEWVEDCYHDSYDGAPENNSAWIDSDRDCDQRVIRGGSWGDPPQSLRSAARAGGPIGNRHNALGFRVSRALSP